MSSVLRPLLLDLADAGCFQPVWSARIGDEWRRNAARIWQIPPETLQAQWDAMNARFPDADAGEFSAYEVGLKYSDPKDVHVIAAGLARRARAAVRPAETRVLTWNLKDFDRSELRRAGMEVRDPDRQLFEWWERDATLVGKALARVPDYTRELGRPGEELAVTLKRERLYRLAKRC
ncbi:PIN domain-containing protein [Pigmentiphaga aceris]|uniref:PIN domain-containing protein n=1 Tax=Pigmentiphaga aceris TaxID=1940612 RepID=A0A5C0B3C4_9BURK|nr:PIN domain-containing protein [Pigmentiphaga aceris]